MKTPTLVSALATCLLVACGTTTGQDGGTDASTDVGSDAGDSGLDVADAADVADAGSAGPDCSFAVDASAPPDGGTMTGLHGVRYCEVLLATLSGGTVNVDVYNTLGVSDCPQDDWSVLDPNALRAQNMVTAVILNGPRYWLIDGFENSMLVDPTVRFFGCIPMRLAGQIQGSASELMAMPYTPHNVMRDTQWVFSNGSTVYELVDPSGRIFDMQSYSVQTTPQTEASLSTLGSRLTLPTGWSYRTRTLTADLIVTAVAGVATVVQDEYKNTYQLSQQ